MNTSKSISPKPVTKKTLSIMLGLVALSFVLKSLPFANYLLGPLSQFEVTVHELGHAFGCVLTGGNVSGLTIVSDGAGHGGLTFCHGGIPFIYGQTGYIGESIFGCLLILGARFSGLSKFLLSTLGLGIGLCSLYFMPGTIFNEGQWLQGLGSLIWGLLMAGALLWAGNKMSSRYAYLFLLFIAVQACLNSVSGMWILLLQSYGFFPGVWSDATNMQQLTGIPSFIWGSFWSLICLGMLGFTLFTTYKMDKA